MAFAASDCFRLKCLRVLETAGEMVLIYILKCGTDSKSPIVSLDEYLRTLPQSSTANYNKKLIEQMRRHPIEPHNLAEAYQSHLIKHFTKADLSQMRRDPSCDNFDITLLYKSIKVACENIAGISNPKWTHESGEMEYLVTKIKNTRNEVVHEKPPMSEHEFLAKLTELSVLLVSTLKATQMRYCRPEGEFTRKKKEVLRAVEDIMKENLGEEEILQRSASKILPLFRAEANKELQNSLDNAKYLDPLHFLSGHEDNRVDVQTVFTRIAMVNEKSESSGRKTKDKDEVIDYLKLLKITQAGEPTSFPGEEPPEDQITRPHVLLIEGDAGSGKTTLITFLLSEWLKDECDRCMEGLDHYDILLWVVCREQCSPLLDGLLKQVLPEAHIKYGHLLLPLLKQCRVLVLIDGLDETNTVSHQLVANILSEGKESTSFTAICTSRPVKVFEFKARMPKNYQTCHIRILGISPEERIHVVVKHYKWLTRRMAGDVDRLRLIMQEIGWRELFRLPLNLLFLSAMAHYDINSINTNITQSQLYQFIHKWCVEKLHHRLAVHATILYSKVNIQKQIHRVLRVVYLLALKGILEDRIYLTEEDQDSLTSSCISEGLPREEVMPAFYSLQRQVTFGVAKERYYAPHKGLQEFFAAQHIIEQLHQYKKGDIRRTLQDSMAGQKLCLQSLSNVLCHVLGLLTRQDNPMAKAMKETVNLIHKSGVQRIHDWLSLVADIEVHPITVQCIAHHIQKDTQEKEIYIHDGTVHAAASLLPLIPRKKVNVIVKRKAGVDTLLRTLRDHKVLRLWLEQDYTHPDPATSSEQELRYVPRDHMICFKGYIAAEHLLLLPKGLRRLSLAVVGNNHASSFLPALRNALPSLPRLCSLVIHVPVMAVTPDALTPLPDAPVVTLTLSGIGEQEIEAACRISAALCPIEKQYWAIRFPEISLRMDGLRQLVKGLAGARVRVTGGIGIPEPAITVDERQQLRTLSRSLLGCEIFRSPPEMLW